MPGIEEVGDQFEVEYTCLGCGLISKVATRHRLANEDLFHWMNEVQRCVGDDHRQRSPICQSDKCDLKLPISDGAKGIGMRVVS